MTSRKWTNRRQVLGALGGASVLGLSGCLDSIRAYIERNPPQQVSLSIKTLPADEDIISIQIARHITENLERAGASIELLPTTADQLLRDVLVNRDFDIYVAQHPGHFDPDFLFSFLHSQFVEEPGWQNPLGYSNVTSVDELLQNQRATDSGERQAILADLQRIIVQDCPFVTIAFPDSKRLIRTDRFSDWGSHSLSTPLGYLSLSRNENDDESEESTLFVGTNDRRITRNRNPIAVEFRFKGILTGLLYDPLGRHIHGTLTPWLADSWEWNRGDETLVVDIKSDQHWHDGEPITAEDVVFTYRFLRDTTMDDGDPVIPAPRYRGASSMIDEVWIHDESRVEFRFGPVSQEVGINALTVPILPRHIWRDYSQVTEIVGLNLDHVTEAILWDNEESIGSGPFQYSDSSVDDYLELTRYENHFLQSLGVDEHLFQFRNKPAYDRLYFRILPSEATIIDLVQTGELDVSAIGLTALEAEQHSETSVQVDQSSAFYHIGFNNRNAPLSNPRFRFAVSRLVDRDYIVNTLLDGDGTPAISPVLVGGDVPMNLRWTPDHEYGFVGHGGSGTVDIDMARELFREAGYLYRDGQLQTQMQ